VRKTGVCLTRLCGGKGTALASEGKRRFPGGGAKASTRLPRGVIRRNDIKSFLLVTIVF